MVDSNTVLVGAWKDWRGDSLCRYVWQPVLGENFSWRSHQLDRLGHNIRDPFIEPPLLLGNINNSCKALREVWEHLQYTARAVKHRRHTAGVSTDTYHYHVCMHDGIVEMNLSPVIWRHTIEKVFMHFTCTLVNHYQSRLRSPGMEVARMPNAKNKSSCGKKKNYVRLKVYLFSKKYMIVFVGAKRHLHHTIVTFSWQCISINTASMCNLGQNLGAENIKGLLAIESQVQERMEKTTVVDKMHIRHLNMLV